MNRIRRSLNVVRRQAPKRAPLVETQIGLEQLCRHLGDATVSSLERGIFLIGAIAGIYFIQTSNAVLAPELESTLDVAIVAFLVIFVWCEPTFSRRHEFGLSD